MTNKNMVILHPYCLLIIMLCLLGLLSKIHNPYASTSAPIMIRTSVAALINTSLRTLMKTSTKILTGTPTRTFTRIPTINDNKVYNITFSDTLYSPPEIEYSIHMEPIQEYKVFLPLVMRPYFDMSYYMVTTSDSYGLGYKRGQQYEAQTTTQNGVVILDFGSPFYYNGNYGTLLFDYTTVIYRPQI